MMGSTAKLMGLAAFNILLALVLSAAYLAQFSGSRLQALTEDDIRAFCYDVSKVTSGKRVGFDSSAVTKFFMNHVAEDGTFRSTLQSKIPGIKPRDVTMDKKAFINDTLQSMRDKGVHDVALRVEGIKISSDGRDATATLTRRESMSIQMAEKKGESEIIPVEEITRCKQELNLSNNHLIQLKNASCTTSIERAD